MTDKPTDAEAVAHQQRIIASARWSADLTDLLGSIPHSAIRSNRLASVLLEKLLQAQDIIDMFVLDSPDGDSPPTDVDDNAETLVDSELAPVIDFRDWKARKQDPSQYFDAVLDRLHEETEDNDDD